MPRVAGVTLVAIALLVCSASAQNQPPSDPQAVTFAAQSIAALTGGAAISDVTLTGNATWFAGSTSDSGPVTLMATAAGQSRIDIQLSGGVRSEIRDASGGVAAGGQWIDLAGIAHDFAFQNCLTDATWFFPALTSLASRSNVVLSYPGQENRQGISVQHLHSYIYSGSSANQQLSAMEFYLDSTSLLPVAITFNAHPDDDQSTNIPVEIDFSGYQTMNGVVVSTHIQKLLNGQMILDSTISGASTNNGLASSIFQLN